MLFVKMQLVLILNFCFQSIAILQFVIKISLTKSCILRTQNMLSVIILKCYLDYSFVFFTKPFLEF